MCSPVGPHVHALFLRKILAKARTRYLLALFPLFPPVPSNDKPVTKNRNEEAAAEAAEFLGKKHLRTSVNFTTQKNKNKTRVIILRSTKGKEMPTDQTEFEASDS